MSTDPQVVSVSASQAGNAGEDSASQAASASCQAGSPREDSASQAASASSQTHSTNSQGASTTPPRSPKLAGSPVVLIPPGDFQEATHWKIPTINGSSIYPLNQAQKSVLAKGPNFVVTPRHPPNLDYITAIEVACTKLGQQDAEET